MPHGRSGRMQKISIPTGIRSPDRPACSESLYRLSYPGLQRIWYIILYYIILYYIILYYIILYYIILYYIILYYSVGQ